MRRRTLALISKACEHFSGRLDLHACELSFLLGRFVRLAWLRCKCIKSKVPSVGRAQNEVFVNYLTESGLSAR